MAAASHTTGSPERGKYQVTPLLLADGSVAYLLLDDYGRQIVRPKTINHQDEIVDLQSDHYANLHVTHAKNLRSITVTSPGVEYANGVNALCIATPEDPEHELELLGVYLSTKTAGDFYLVADNLGLSPGETTGNTFDLVGIYGDGVTNTCDVLWAAFLANNARGVTGGDFHEDLGLDVELYLIAPNVSYTITVMWMDIEP